MSLHPECLRGSWHLEGVQYLWTSNCRSLQAALQTLGSMFDSPLSLNELNEIWGAKLNNDGQGSTTNPATIPELVMSVAGFTQEKKKKQGGELRGGGEHHLVQFYTSSISHPLPYWNHKERYPGRPSVIQVPDSLRLLPSHPTALFQLPDKMSAPPGHLHLPTLPHARSPLNFCHHWTTRICHDTYPWDTYPIPDPDSPFDAPV